VGADVVTGPGRNGRAPANAETGRRRRTGTGREPNGNGVGADRAHDADGAGQAPPEVFPGPDDPMGVARSLADRHRSEGGVLLVRSWRGGWMRWTPAGCWIEDELAAVRAAVYRDLERVVYVDDKDRTAPWLPNRHRVADVLDALRAVSHLDEGTESPSWLDGAEGPPAGELVALRNGLLHVTTRQVLAHDPRFFTRVAVPFPYDPDAPEPLGWLRFLHDLWPDDEAAIEALQQWFGYVLSGRTDLHKIMLMVGPTRAGKGVIARVLAALVGRGNVAGPTLAGLATNFGLAPLIGKPLALVSDARLGGNNVHQVVERLLSISGEDLLTIDRKYREPWTGKLTTRFLVISNELPNFGDASGAIARRFLVLTLGQSWLGRENPDLTAELLGELTGILRWSLDGLDTLTRRGRFSEPQSSADAVTALQDIVSPVSAFVRDRCEQGPYEVAVAELYDAWRSWADDNGHRITSAQRFGKDLRAVIPGLRETRPRIHGTQVRCYAGVRLATRE
jgi:putative DNA primase/helicase